MIILLTQKVLNSDEQSGHNSSFRYDTIVDTKKLKRVTKFFSIEIFLLVSITSSLMFFRVSVICLLLSQ